jgi:hypothetical protein
VQMLVVTQRWWHPLIASLICNGVQASQRRKRVATVKTRESLFQLQLLCEDGFGCRQAVYWDSVTVAGVGVSIRVLHCF